jgi:hypothetical protein
MSWICLTELILDAAKSPIVWLKKSAGANASSIGRVMATPRPGWTALRVLTGDRTPEHLGLRIYNTPFLAKRLRANPIDRILIISLVFSSIENASSIEATSSMAFTLSHFSVLSGVDSSQSVDGSTPNVSANTNINLSIKFFSFLDFEF